jgi:hypothetical protein
MTIQLVNLVRCDQMSSVVSRGEFTRSILARLIKNLIRYTAHEVCAQYRKYM